MTKNLLLDHFSFEEMVTLLERHPVRPILPVLGDPRWAAALSNPALAAFCDELIRRALVDIHTPFPELTDELYRDYAATGVRLRFEQVYFERRRQLARAALALLASPKAARGEGPALLRSFLAKLDAIFSEVSWALPAHVATDNVTGRDPLCLDLFAAETANLIAECINVFGAIIPPEVQARMRKRLHRDVFINYCEHADDGAILWTKISSNWNAVCHQGIVGAALAIEDDPRRLARMLTAAARHLPHFLDGFGADGGCVEGPTYWVYGFGWFSVLNEQLEARTDGELSLFAENPKINAIARYGPLACLDGQKVVNFADATSEAVLRPSLLHYLGERLGERSCTWQAEENYAYFRDHGLDADDQRADLFFLLRLFLHCPRELPVSAPKVGGELKPDAYFPDLAVWIVRGRDAAGHLWEVAAKGGHNAEHHNHADLGSFMVNLDGVPLITEIGAPEYTRDYFDLAHRYTCLATRTLGHSLPIINGCEQPEGLAYTSRISKAQTGAEELTFEVDLAKAYPAAAQCEKFTRQLRLGKTNGRLVVTDEIKLARIGSVESAVITEDSTVQIISPQLAVIEKGALRVEMKLENGARWDRVETHSYKAHHGKPASISRLVMRPLVYGECAHFEYTIQLP